MRLCPLPPPVRYATPRPRYRARQLHSELVNRHMTRAFVGVRLGGEEGVQANGKAPNI